MANITDPLITQLSGSDPQNLMEYITRQKIYDSRFWKEECFGMSATDVLEKAVSLECLGGLPTRFLSLTLKLLQLHPESEVIIDTFIEQEDFKYVRALGCLYLRMTGRPDDIYNVLEPLYRDGRKLRRYLTPNWSIVHFDDFVHELLTETHVVGIALPRLPLRRVLVEAGYLEDGPRPSALHDVLVEHGGPLQYLKYKALVEKSAPAIELCTQRGGSLEPEPEVVEEAADDSKRRKDGKPPKKKKKRNYDNLFKKSKSSSEPSAPSASATSASAGPAEGSDEYWDAERAKLGLKPLRK